jgi:hypothetical protein
LWKVLNLWKLFVECRLNTVIIVYRAVKFEWIDHFRNGRTSVCDEERSGRLSTSRTENKLQAVGRIYGLDDRDSRVRFPAEAGNFSLKHRVQNGSGAHPASYPMDTRGSFPGGKAAGA